MKLFIFEPHEYGEFYIVMAESKESALKAIKKMFLTSYEKVGKEKIDTRGNKYDSSEYREYLRWKDVTVNNLPKAYTLDEYGKNIVIEREYC